MTSQSLAHVDRLPVEVRPLVKEDAPVVEAKDQDVPPFKRSLLSPCSASASETSDVRDLRMTSFLHGLRLADPCPRPVVHCPL